MSDRLADGLVQPWSMLANRMGLGRGRGDLALFAYPDSPSGVGVHRAAFDLTKPSFSSTATPGGPVLRNKRSRSVGSGGRTAAFSPAAPASARSSFMVSRPGSAAGCC